MALSMFMIWRSRSRQLMLALVSVVILLTIYPSFSSPPPTARHSGPITGFDDQYQAAALLDESEEAAAMTAFRTFINYDILLPIAQARPSIPPIDNQGHYSGDNAYPRAWDGRIPVLDGKIREDNGVDPVRSKDYLDSFLQLTENELSALRDSHKAIIESLPQRFPDEIDQLFHGKGILYIGGGQYNWLILLSLRMLRESGSKLPVEIFIPADSERSSQLCNRVFPSFGAKCVLMSNYIDTKKFKLEGYQLKSMALLLTSFENILLMDSDNVFLKNPDELFEKDPYASAGMIVWPDFWRRSISPKFYEVAGIPVNERNKVRSSYGDDRDTPTPLETLEDYNTKVSYHDLDGTIPEASSEAGQFMINKKSHARAIFLSLYYNYYGPDYYYALLSQGQAGEGDKETFLAAAHKCGLPYYQVKEYIREFGEMKDEYDFDIAAMGQYDPILDYQQSLEPDKYNSDFKYDKTKNNYLRHKYTNSEMIFLHCNNPKLYPWNIEGKKASNVIDSEGKRRRLYSKALIQECGFDAEARLWEAMKWVLCECDELALEGVKQTKRWCTQATKQLDFLKRDVLRPGQDAATQELEGRASRLKAVEVQE